MKKKFEYYSIQLDQSIYENQANLNLSLDNIGRLGWELVSTVVIDSHIHFFFKRRQRRVPGLIQDHGTELDFPDY